MHCHLFGNIQTLSLFRAKPCSGKGGRRRFRRSHAHTKYTKCPAFPRGQNPVQNICPFGHTFADWPRLLLEVWHQDALGRSELVGYGSQHVPSSPGHHVVDCPTWRPLGTLSEEASRHFLGGGLHLRDPDACGRPGSRFQLRTEAMGVVHLDLYIIHRDFHKYGIEA